MSVARSRKQAQTQTQAITRIPGPQPAMTPFTLHGIEQAEALADRLAKSGLVPSTLRGKPDDILVILMTGHELAMPPMRSLQDLVVIEGKVGMYADAAVAMVKSKPGRCEYFKLIETTTKSATYETKEVGAPEPVRLTWTIEQAQRAQLLGKDPWKKYPEAMLRHRCAFALARSEYPDLLRNVYDREDEMDEILRDAINVTPPKVIPSSPRLIPQTETAPSNGTGNGHSASPSAAEPPVPPAKGEPSTSESSPANGDPRPDEQRLQEAKASVRELLVQLYDAAKVDARLATITTMEQAFELEAKAHAAIEAKKAAAAAEMDMTA